MISVISKPNHLALFWLAWDIGENISSILKLKRKHIKKEINRDTKEEEYIIYLPKEILKRTRKSRSEPTIYYETVKMLDVLLKVGKEVECRNKKGQFQRKYEPYKDDDFLFGFGYKQASKIFDRIVEKVCAKCEPTGKKASWTNMRKGMACTLHLKGWSVEDINMRLGHSPISRWFDSYVNYLAVNRKKVIKKFYNHNLEDLKNDLDDSKQREKLIGRRFGRQEEELNKLRSEIENFKNGKGFMKIMMNLVNKRYLVDDVFEQMTNPKFDITLPEYRDFCSDN